MPPARRAARHRPAHPVPDLMRFLAGEWRVSRVGVDRGAGRTMRFVGTAWFRRASPGLHVGGLDMEERGTMACRGQVWDAARSYGYRPRGASGAAVLFGDGLLFHNVDLATGAACVRHLCGPDLYAGRYRVLGPGAWLLGWRVTGPRKDQVIAARYVRLPA